MNWSESVTGLIASASATCGLGLIAVTAYAVDAKIAAGGAGLYSDHALALNTAGQVIVWGNGDRGQLGLPVAPGSEEQYAPQIVSALAGQVFVDIAGGPWNTVAARNDGSVWVWGTNSRTGGLGVADGGARYNVPTQLAGLTDVVAVAAGEETAYAITRSGQLYYWGEAFGAHPADERSRVPKLAVGLANIVQASASDDANGCAVDRNGVMYVWGRASAFGGATATIAGNDVVSVYPVNGKVRKCSAGTDSMVALMENGDVLATGELCTTKLTGGILPTCTGDGFFRTPTKLAFPEPMRDFDINGVAVSASGRVYGFGDASTTLEIEVVPELAAQGSFVRAVGRNGVGIYLAQTADGRVFSWGTKANRSPSLGRGDLPVLTRDYDRPRQVVGVVGSGALNLTIGNDVIGNNRRFAEQVYRDFLLREGDLGGIDFWVAALDNNLQTRESMIRTFVTSPEYLGAIAPLTRLYLATYLRIPDFAGLRFWTNVFRSGTQTIENISAQFVTVPEFTARYGNPTNPQFVDLMFRNIFKRPADAAGAQFWTGELNANRISRGGLLLEFSRSAEFVGSNQADVLVVGLYAALLSRSPSEAELNADRTLALSNLDALIQRIQNSAEYRARFVG